MQKNIIVLGTGLVGTAIAIDLGGKNKVTAVDLNTESFELLKKHGITPQQADLTVPGEINNIVSESDLVIGALPGHMGYQTVKAVIEAGKNMVDISFMPEDYLELDSLARRNEVTTVVDCGVSPGMGNLFLGYHDALMEVSDFACYVGGLPRVREWPYEYKAVFSPIDVIEEYTRPARYFRNGTLITGEALSDVEMMNFSQVGTLEAWNSDGLRSLLRTMNVPNMIEKTLRYPGTTEYIKLLRETGFFSYREVDVNGNKIRPIDLTAKLLFPLWKLKQDDRDLTIMRIIIKGLENNKAVSYTYDLYDEYNEQTKTISMARTTGYTATAAASLILENRFSRKGVCPPEYIGGEEGNLDFVLSYLKERGITYAVNKED